MVIYLRICAYLLLVLFLLSGCDSNQYQIVTASDGGLYRFNKKTGELSLILDDKRSAKSTIAPKGAVIKQEQDVFLLDKPIDWKESRYPGKNLKVRLETVWRENKLCYRFSAWPYKSLEKMFEKKKQDYVYGLMRPGFTVELVDKNGFMIKEIKINLWSMTRVPPRGGKEEELVTNSQIDCTKQSYESIGGYTVKWQLDADLVEDAKEVYLKSEALRGER